MALDRGQWGGHLPPLADDDAWAGWGSGVLFNGIDLGWERRAQARRRLQKLRAREHKHAQQTGRLRWEDPQVEARPSPLSLENMGLPSFVVEGLRRNTTTALALVDEPAPAQKRARRQASPLADQLRALLESDATLSVPDLMAAVGCSRAYAQRAKRLMREERSA